MNCPEVLSTVPLHLTGELDPVRASALTEHLRDCQSCAAEVGRQAALDARLRASIEAEPVDSTAVERSIRQAIAAESSPRIGALGWIYATAGVVAALVLTFVGYRMTHPLTAAPALAAAARDHHAEIVDRQSRRWQTDRASIEQLAAQQGIPAAAIVGFGKEGFHLEQAKLCHLEKVVFLHLVYSNGKAQFSMFLRQDGPSTHDSIDTANIGADHVAAFHHGPLNAIVVTDQPGDEASHLARFAAAALEQS
jgi:hypothetical protein